MSSKVVLEEKKLFDDHKHLGVRNILNGILMFAVIVPSLYMEYYNRHVANCESHRVIAQTDPPASLWRSPLAIPFNTDPHTSSIHLLSVPTDESSLCWLWWTEPISYVNFLFTFNVVIGFWIIQILTNSTWLIDPYWTLAPVAISSYFVLHPRASDVTSGLKSNSLGRNWIPLAQFILIIIWSARLTHNYFRRERYKFGVREDWRFSDMRERCGRWVFSLVISLPYAYISQQPLIVGLVVPLGISAFDTGVNSRETGMTDIACIFGCVAGLHIAGKADSELRKFMAGNEERVAAGKSKKIILEKGMWRYSRHPNYFGEQLFWWSFAAMAAPKWIAFAGTVVNSLVLAQVTMMTEARMLADEKRKVEYLDYCERVSCVIPWFRSRSTKNARGKTTKMG